MRTPVEDSKLRRRPQEWRLACQALVEKSVMVLTRPQMRLPEAETRLAAARQAPLPVGPTAWPSVPDEELESEDELSDEPTLDKGSAATADEEG